MAISYHNDNNYFGNPYINIIEGYIPLIQAMHVAFLYYVA